MTTSRRQFLATTAAAAAGSLFLPSCRFGPRLRPPVPDDQPLRLFAIGVGGRGRDNLEAVAHEQVAIVCDVDERHLAAALKLCPGARAERDFRTVFADPVALAQLDGVVIGTPDHTHFLPALLALRHGLDVYCEKPLTQTVAQARRLRELAAANGCVTQMGTQIHANANYHRVVEAIRTGAVGTVREVVVFVNGTDWSASALPKPAPVPEHLHYDLWLGPSAERPFTADYHPAGWRRYWAFGGGTTADMACHYLDLAWWALELDAPTSLLADGPPPHAEGTPKGMRCEYAFPPRGERAAVVVRWHAGADRPTAALQQRGLEDWRNGVLFLGDDGWLISNYDRYVLGPAARAAAFVPPAPFVPDSPGHHREWLAACRRRTQPSCHFGYSGPLTEAVLLANVAYRAAAGRRLTWDAAALRTGDEAADALLDLPARRGFAG